ncbi:DUF456 domain-containing protein [Olleya sp. HaHaR_3_96]|uniref:DUF456 domain-containing protein n=1 Tax=Olleya sp. HaHaR_3_96 TaxID=2745560 RepID=UPI001C4F6226|nr:DUF456 domain-containing protein [Olleya sp. HaHaR_3_96]QXP60296.1 DUF456 domain-containing protein [Olleya sp. HaHaR_3_96]
MDIIFTLLGFLFMVLGLAGSLLPILPGPPLSWLGLLLIYMTDAVPNNITFLIITLIIALAIFILDYFIPAMGTKRFGGSKAGVTGSTIGLIIGLLAPIPGGIIIGPFVGAFIGEKSNNANTDKALKVAFGSFLGFVTGAFLKLIIAIIYFGYFIQAFWTYKNLML